MFGTPKGGDGGLELFIVDNSKLYHNIAAKSLYIIFLLITLCKGSW